MAAEPKGVDPKVVAALRRVVGGERCRTDRESRICYSYDATQQQAMPDVVVTPKTAQEISAVMTLAYEYLVPVYPRGAGSGLTGGAVPPASSCPQPESPPRVASATPRIRPFSYALISTVLF